MASGISSFFNKSRLYYKSEDGGPVTAVPEEKSVGPESTSKIDRKTTVLTRFSQYGELFSKLPVAVIVMLLLADFCNYYMQRSTVTWLYYLELTDGYVGRFTIDHLVAEFIVGSVAFSTGVIADSYTGHYRCIMYGNYISLVLATIYLGFAAYNKIDDVHSRFILYTSPLFTLMRGVRLAYLSEQIRLPQHEMFLGTYTFLMVFVRNAARGVSSLLYEGMRSLSDEFEDLSYTLFVSYVALTLIAGIVNLALVFFSRKKAYHESVYPGICIKVFHCMFYCIFKKLTNRNKTEDAGRKHWTDYGEEKFDDTIRTSCSVITKLPVVFIPLIFNSFMRGTLLAIWDFQQTYVMHGYRFVPLSMKEVYNYLSIVLLPIVHYLLKPLLKTQSIFVNDIHYVSLGYFLTGLAVALTAIIQAIIDTRYHGTAESMKVSLPLREIDFIQKNNISLHNSSIFKKHMFNNISSYVYMNKLTNYSLKTIDTIRYVNSSGQNKSYGISKEIWPAVLNFYYEEDYPNFLFALYPQVIIAVIGDCIMMPSLIVFTYKHSPPKIRATLPAFGFTTEAVGRGLLALLLGPLGISSDTKVLKIWTTTFFMLYLVYLYFILNIKFSKDDIDEM